jgi:signal recognition particle subunit SRP54
MFDNLSDRFESALRKLSGQDRISESNVAESMEEVRQALLEADVQYDVAEGFVERVQTQAMGQEVLAAVKPGQQMIKIVNDELVRLLGGEPAPQDEEQAAGAVGEPGSASGGPAIMAVSPGPTVVMMCGLQGSGKTTTCGKLAAYLKKRGKRVSLAAVDLQRPAAVEQLRVLATQVQNEVEGDGRVGFYGEPDKVAAYGEAVGVAVQVARRAVDSARAEGADVLILDTAGRLHLNNELMGELRGVAQATGPHHIFLVLDAMTGQDAVQSAKAFNEQLELDAVILTKFDSDTRGGAALSVREVTGKPIKFIGTGEKIDALERFHPERIAGRILGMGDVVSLVEKAQEQVSEEEAMALQEKMLAGKMTMDDFLVQLKRIRKMGSMKSLLGMLPGIGKQLKDLPIDDKQIDRTEAMIQSMTTPERRDVDLLNNSRRRRVARGSGTDQRDVSQLVKGFEMVSQMSKTLGGLGGPGGGGAGGAMSAMQRARAMQGMGGMDPSVLGGMPGMGGKASTKQGRPGKYKQRKKRRR